MKIICVRGFVLSIMLLTCISVSQAFVISDFYTVSDKHVGRGKNCIVEMVPFAYISQSDPDTIPPDITCSPDIEANVDPGECTAVVNYAYPIATDASFTFDSGIETFDYTGTEQTWVVPEGVTYVTIEAYGAQGGNGEYHGSIGVGGLGGYSIGKLAVTPGQTLFIYVGQQGPSNTGNNRLTAFNGGGAGYGDSNGIRGSGGGASDVRVGGNTFYDRVIVAGGGGGACCYTNGGDGGGLSGGGGTGNFGGGGTQTEGGQSGLDPGSFGLGGSNMVSTSTVSGGGGGYYGGGVGNPAGGGSGYIGGVYDAETTEGVKTGNGQVVIHWETSYVVQTTGLPTGSEFPAGTTINTFVSTDASGNSSSCSFNVVVNDNEPPVISCPSSFAQSTDHDACTYTINNPVVVNSKSYYIAPANLFNLWECATGIFFNEPGNCGFSWNDDQLGTATSVNLSFSIAAEYLGEPRNTFLNGYAESSYNVSNSYGCSINTNADHIVSMNLDAAHYVVGGGNTFWVEENGMTWGLQTDEILNGYISRIDVDYLKNADYDPVYSDNCPGAQITYVLTGATEATGSGSLEGVSINKGITQVEWTVTDATGNTASCSYQITVTDDQEPEITCPQNLSVSTDDGLCTASGVELGTPIAFDNCNYTLSNNAVQPFSLGETVVTWTILDGSGHSATCQQTVTVTDNEIPEIECPQDVSVQTDAGLCTASGVDLGTSITSDNCGVFSVLNDAVEPYLLGHNIVIWTVNDVHGHSVTCQQMVTVSDNEFPEIICPQNITVNTDDGSCTASGVELGIPSADDNCSYEVINDATEPYSLGETSITWSVIDASDNTATCQQVVTVTDVELPEITCPQNVSVNSDAGACTASGVELGIPTASDNCNFTVSNDALEPYVSGETTIIWTVTDGSDNTATCQQTVTVSDNELPQIACPQDVLVHTDAGICTASGVDLGTPIASDNCGVFNVVNDAAEPYVTGQTVVTWTVIDINGNAATCQQMVSVSDNELPEIICPQNITVNTDDGSCTASGVELGIPSADDNCSYEVINDATEPYSLGETLITWTVIDASDNTATCQQIVTVTDTELPEIICPQNIYVNSDAGACTASGVELGIPTASDNCNFTVSNNVLEPYVSGETTVIWTVTDGSDNTATCQQTVTVNDNEIPEITCPQDVSVHTDAGICTASGVDLGTPIASDNCGVFNVVNDAAEPYVTGQTVVTWTVTDVNGNSASCQQMVTVIDNEMPVVVCPDDVVVANDYGQNYATGVELGEISAGDNCEIASIGNNSPEYYPIGTTDVVWNIADIHGNTANCTQQVIVEDHTSVQYVKSDPIGLTIRPNPVQATAEIGVVLTENAVISLRIVDVSGKTVAILADDNAFSAGTHFFNYSVTLHGINPGMYYVQLISGRATLSKKLVVY